jgi:hypothetical protein
VRFDATERRRRVRVMAERSGPSVRIDSGAAATVEAGPLESVLTATVVEPVSGGTYAESSAQLRNVWFAS